MTDFIKELFFLDYPGLSLAIDPITLITTLGPMAAEYFGGRKVAKTETELAEGRKLEAEKQYQNLLKDMPSFGVSDSFRQFLATSKQDPAADMNRQIAAEQEASTVDALKTAGSKALLGGLSGAQRQSALRRMDIESKSFNQMQDALKTFAGVEQRASDLQTNFDQNLATTQMDAAQLAAQSNQNVIDQMRRDKQSANIQGISSLLGNADIIANAFKSKGGGGGGTGAGGGFGAIGGGGGGMAGSNYSADMKAKLFAGLPGYDANGNPIEAEEGMVTPGQFSHENNPIDIVQEGVKIAEMTGGEAILNPEQQEKVSKQSPYFRKLMIEFAMKAQA